MRDALVASVAWTLPPVSRHSRYVSTVPKASSPRAAQSADLGVFLQQPRELGAGEIGIEQKPGPGGEGRLEPVAFEARANVGGATILPDDGAMDRASGAAVPQQRGFALIGDADSGDILGAGAGLAHGSPAGLERRRPEVLGLVLDLAAGRKMLGKFLLGERRDRRIGAKQDGPRRGRALVDRKDVGRHLFPSHGGRRATRPIATVKS